MKHNTNKFLCLLLAVVLMVGVLPMQTAYAAKAKYQSDTTVSRVDLEGFTVPVNGKTYDPEVKLAGDFPGEITRSGFQMFNKDITGTDAHAGDRVAFCVHVTLKSGYEWAESKTAYLNGKPQDTIVHNDSMGNEYGFIWELEIGFTDSIKITDQSPETVEYAAGEDVTLFVTANGASGYQWQVYEMSGGGGKQKYSPKDVSGAIGSRYVINNATAELDGKMYRCILHSEDGEIYSGTMTLKMVEKAAKYHVDIEGGYVYFSDKTEFAEGESFSIHAYTESIPAGKYVEKFVDKKNGIEVTSPRFRMPAHDVSLEAVYADQKDYIIDLSSGTATISTRLGDACPFIDNTGRNPFSIPGGTKFELNDDGIADLEMPEPVGDGNVVLKKLSDITGDVAWSWPGFEYRFILRFGGSETTAPPLAPGPGSGSVAETSPFEDISIHDSYYDAVIWAYNAEPQVTNGKDKTHFAPKDPVTRGQCVTFLWRAMGCPEPKNTKNSFTDVKSSDYYFKPVLWAVENGITKGVDAEHFDPSAPLSTQHIITFLYRTLNPGKDGWGGEAKEWAGKDYGGKPFGVDVEVSNTVECKRWTTVQFLFEALVEKS